MNLSTKHNGPIHLLLTDVLMPGTNGPVLARQIATTRPDMKVVYMSGYTGFHDQGLLDPDALLIAKPIHARHVGAKNS